MDVQMKYTSFKPSNNVSVVSSIQNLQTTWNSHKTHESIEIWLLLLVIWEPDKAALSHHVSTDTKTDDQQKQR